MESPDVIPLYSVLFVDDTELLLDIGKQILEISGHLRIDTAVSAAMAMGSSPAGSTTGSYPITRCLE